MDSALLLAQPESPRCDWLLAEQLATELHDWLGLDVELWDAATRSRLVGEARCGETLCENTSVLDDLLEKGQASFVSECDPVLVAGLPLTFVPVHRWVAVFPILARPLEQLDDLRGIGELLGIEPEEVITWGGNQSICAPEMCLRLCTAYLSNRLQERQLEKLGDELQAARRRLSANFEEIALLHRLAQNSLSNFSDEGFGRQTIEWLKDSVPAMGCGLYLLPESGAAEATYDARATAKLVTAGEFPIELRVLEAAVAKLQPPSDAHPRVVSTRGLQAMGGPSEAQELLVQTIRCRDQVFGHLMVVHRPEMGSFEAKELNLLVSVAAILGAHCANHEYYRQQSEFLASFIRALTSAIDAKDPYTCGHSDRVARIAVRLARELDCSPEELHTVYIGSLVHDVGKIGISDAILRKPGALTPEEFEHIKQHPELGSRILADIQQLAEVLPIVLHHHEQWNGKGYPAGLKEKQIPLLARVMAVADAFDAMTNSRCYRQGIPLEKVEQILRQGAGQQWDPAVISAYFRARTDIQAISQNERESLSLNVESWQA